MNEAGHKTEEMITIPLSEYEELNALIPLVAQLTAKITELEARLNKNSKNSDKPPSSDDPGAKAKNKAAYGGLKRQKHIAQSAQNKYLRVKSMLNYHHEQIKGNTFG